MIAVLVMIIIIITRSSATAEIARMRETATQGHPLLSQLPWHIRVPISTQ